MKKLCILLTIALIAMSCSEEIRDRQGMIGHTVYIDLKNDITDAETTSFITELKGLAAIDYLHDLELSKRISSGDLRQDRDFDVVMTMYFEDLDALDRYQQDSLHVEIRTATRKYLAAPPVIYDFKVE